MGDTANLPKLTLLISFNIFMVWRDSHARRYPNLLSEHLCVPFIFIFVQLKTGQLLTGFIERYYTTLICTYRASRATLTDSESHNDHFVWRKRRKTCRSSRSWIRFFITPSFRIFTAFNISVKWNKWSGAKNQKYYKQLVATYFYSGEIQIFYNFPNGQIL